MLAIFNEQYDSTNRRPLCVKGAVAQATGGLWLTKLQSLRLRHLPLHKGGESLHIQIAQQIKILHQPRRHEVSSSSEAKDLGVVPHKDCSGIKYATLPKNARKWELMYLNVIKWLKTARNLRKMLDFSIFVDKWIKL